MSHSSPRVRVAPLTSETKPRALPAWSFRVAVNDGREPDYAEARFELSKDGGNQLRLVAPLSRTTSGLLTWYLRGDSRYVVIEAMNAYHKPVGKYTLTNAEPAKYSLAWDAASNKHLIEHLTLKFGEIRVQE
jgi:hypothetical protein